MTRTLRWFATALALLLAATAALAGPAGGAPSQDTHAVEGSSSRVTLITGDVVELTEAASGRYAVAVEPGPGRESVTFHTTETDDGMQVLPGDAVPYVSAGVLDEALFDVPALIEQGYDDASSPRMPLIVGYRDSSGAEAETLAGVQTVHTFDSISGASLTAGKDDLHELWGSLTEPAGRSGADPSFAAGIAEIWLDARVEPTLDRSVAQIGAPQAWDAGFDGTGVDVAVLDTGIDFNHPDVKDRIGAAENFSNALAPTDLLGHGTHVAATIAGSGAASDGARKGVAPGADLLIGKVLNDAGQGYMSWIIAGMEWAVAQGADVVNMSLGGAPTDGTDPMSQAVNRLSEKGVLFVTSAGNNGEDYSVGNPGAATSALTVGAVDRDESLADFSSRGPRRGDNALKPEITAPGVGIVAARGAGTSLGSPVDRDYTALSGTSMAAPHVAGAAALLAHQHPDWSGAQLKDALVSTARTHPDLGIFAQGAGRVDAARAVTQGVHGIGVVDFGLQQQPDTPAAPATKVLTYTNGTEAAVTLDLEADVSNIDRSTPANGGVTLSVDQVTVPAGGTADVEVRFDPAKLERGRSAGWITATGSDGVEVTTAVAGTVVGPKRTVTFRVIGRSGDPAYAQVIGLQGEDPRQDVRYSGSELTLELEEGTYLLHALVTEGQPSHDTATLVTDPELEVSGDMEVVIDARDGSPVRIETPRRVERRAFLSYFVHRVMANGRVINNSVMHYANIDHLHVTPTAPLKDGEYEFASRWQLIAPRVTATAPGLGSLDVDLLPLSPAFDQPRQLPLVFAGSGTPEELAAAGVDGKAALVEGSLDRAEREQVVAAADAGASAVFIVRPASRTSDSLWWPGGARDPIPALVVGHGDGQRLIEAANAGDVRLRLRLETNSPYLYDVMHVEHDRVPEEIVHRVTESNSARVDVGYSDPGGFEWMMEQRFGWRPWLTYAPHDTRRFVQAGTERAEWVSAGDDTIWQHRVHHIYTEGADRALLGGLTETPHTHVPGSAGADEWLSPVVRPGIPAGVPDAASFRDGDRLTLAAAEFVDATGSHFGLANNNDDVSARLLRDGEIVAELPNARQDVETTAEDAAYRLELTTARESEEWTWGTRTETAWEFRSARPAGDESMLLPLLQVDYDAPVDLDGQVSGRRQHRLGLELRHQDGLPAPTAGTVRAEVSFDEGETWQPVTVRGAGSSYRAFIPAGRGTVSLRVHAEDGNGNSVEQTIIRAYGLT